jgi:hypothetical protein
MFIYKLSTRYSHIILWALSTITHETTSKHPNLNRPAAILTQLINFPFVTSFKIRSFIHLLHVNFTLEVRLLCTFKSQTHEAWQHVCLCWRPHYQSFITLPYFKTFLRTSNWNVTKQFSCVHSVKLSLHIQNSQTNTKVVFLSVFTCMSAHVHPTTYTL